jgi:hypothetical protein
MQDTVMYVPSLCLPGQSISAHSEWLICLPKCCVSQSVYLTPTSIFHISIWINCNQISEGLLQLDLLDT